MINFIKAYLSISLLSLTSFAFADNMPVKGKTTCYLAKNDKLQKKASCTYKGNTNYFMSGALHQGTFTVKGVKKPIEVSLNSEFEGDYREYLLNGNESIRLLRSKSSFKKLNDKEIEQLLETDNGSKQLISCVKDEKSKQEFCFDADDFGNL